MNSSPGFPDYLQQVGGTHGPQNIHEDSPFLRSFRSELLVGS